MVVFVVFGSIQRTLGYMLCSIGKTWFFKFQVEPAPVCPVFSVGLDFKSLVKCKVESTECEDEERTRKLSKISSLPHRGKLG